MKLLLDECVPRKLKQHLNTHECYSVPELGWSGKKNGELLSIAEQGGFTVFLTLDQGVEFEQNLAARKLSVIVLRGRSSRLSDLVAHVPEVLKSITSVQPGQLVRIPSR